MPINSHPDHSTLNLLPHFSILSTCDLLRICKFLLNFRYVLAISGLWKPQNHRYVGENTGFRNAKNLVILAEKCDHSLKSKNMRLVIKDRLIDAG